MIEKQYFVPYPDPHSTQILNWPSPRSENLSDNKGFNYLAGWNNMCDLMLQNDSFTHLTVVKIS
jgi:hypothetical protein